MNEHELESFRKEMEKILPKFNTDQSPSYFTGIVSWIFIALFTCAAAWVVGAMVGFAVSGYHLITRLLG